MTRIIFIDSFPLSNYRKLQYVSDAYKRYQRIIQEFSTRKTFDNITYCEYSLEMCHAIFEILKQQVKIHRHIVFPHEFKKIWHFCIKCQTKKFFLRITQTDPNCEPKVNELFKCESCEFVDYEWILINTIKQSQVSAIPCPKIFEDKMKIYYNVFTKIWYYKKIKINYDDFIISLHKKFMCPICRKVLSQKDSLRHFNSIFKNHNHPCIKYYKLETFT